MLRNDDVIQLGVNLVRFREVHKHVLTADEYRRADERKRIDEGRPAVATPLVAHAVALGLPPVAKAAPPQASPPAQPKPPPVPPAAAPRPSPVVAGPPMAKAAPAQAAPPPPRIVPRPPARPAIPAPAPPAPHRLFAANAHAVTDCPICGRPGTAVPQTGKRRCSRLRYRVSSWRSSKPGVSDAGSTQSKSLGFSDVQNRSR